MTTTVLQPKWHDVKEVASLLGFSVSKTKMLIAQRKIRSLKVGHHRRVLPQWVDEFIARQVEECADE